MSDKFDEAQEVTEMLLQQSLKARAKIADKTGFCLFCDEPTVGAFCSKECREDYERMEKIKSIGRKR